MKNRVITISREFGSGGRTIGKKVAEKLGIPCYDAEIIQEMAKETGFALDYVKEAGEYAPGSFLSEAFSNRMFGPTNKDILWEHQYKVIIIGTVLRWLSCSPVDKNKITHDKLRRNACTSVYVLKHFVQRR